MNREKHLIKTFPTKDGKTYIQSLDEFNSNSNTRKNMQNIPPNIEYKGVKLQQQKNYQEPFKSLISKIRPQRVLEIGTGLGGFVLFLRDTLNENGLNNTIIKTYDIFDLKPEIDYSLFDLKNIEYNIENIFDEQYNLINHEHIKNFIQQEGVTLVLCDGYEKKLEFRTLCQLLKNNDLIMAHDYVKNKETFEEFYVDKIWDWCEITNSDISEICMEQNLLDYMKEEFEKIVWTCKIKN